jgi:hypothetical protein
MRAGAAYRAVRTWMAPAGGRIRVSGSVRGDQGARARVVLNVKGSESAGDDVVLWDWHPVSGRPAKHSLTADVREGSVVRFILDAGTGGRDRRADWDPTVTYVEGRQP